MKKKEKYTSAKLEVIEFDAENVITTSNPGSQSSSNETPFEPVKSSIG